MRPYYHGNKTEDHVKKENYRARPLNNMDVKTLDKVLPNWNQQHIKELYVTTKRNLSQLWNVSLTSENQLMYLQNKNKNHRVISTDTERESD